MEASQLHVPTLLIGLGGTGSLVVDQVYHLIPPHRRTNIAVHAFDTNVNDIAKLRYLDRDTVTQTSINQTVGHYLRRAGEHVQEWFPHEIRLLRRKLLTEGAGQVRAVSRLAYRAAMQEGKLHPLEQQVRSVFVERGDRLDTSVRVMIVSTLAGGTGAGLFLQTALYVRELLAAAFGKQSVLVRGAFLLPDALIRTDLIPQEQHEALRANAYASLKELDAVTQNAAVGERAQIELEYRPGGVIVLDERHFPYDFCFLYDFENTRGHNLRAWPNYVEQVAQTVFLQLFTPISENSFSIEDNMIRATINEQARNLYGGAGVARLIYPYSDVLDYLALRWSTGSLNDEWLRLDRDFDEEYRRYEQDLNEGVTRRPPRLPERFPRLLEHYATGDNPDPFFRAVHAQTFVLDEEGAPLAPKADRFIRAVEEEIERVLQTDAVLNTLESDAETNAARVQEAERAQREITRVEDALLRLQREIDEAVQGHKLALFNDIVTRDCDRPEAPRDADHHLNSWMLARKKPLHPVAVRSVLYQVQLALEQRVQTLQHRNDERRRVIRDYERAYDDQDKSPDYVERPEDRLREALRQNWIRQILSSEFKEFAEEYVEKSRAQRQHLITYKQDMLKELVLSDVLGAAKTMLEEWERFFANLREIRNRLLTEQQRRATEHEQSLDPTKRYVLATKRAKDELWEDVRIRLAGGVLPEDIAQRLYVGQYRRFCQQQRQRRRTREAQDADSTERLFREHVFAWCRGQLAREDQLNLDLVQALRREADLQGTDAEAHLRERFGQLDRTAAPLLPPGSQGQNILLWAVHPASHGQLNEQLAQALMGDAPIVDEAFSRYEAVRYRALYGLQADHLPKFAARTDTTDPGPYFAAYRDLCKRLEQNPGTEVTPHLDKRWHRHAFMPDIGQEVEQETEEKIRRAVILGLAHGLLRTQSEDRRLVWKYVGPNQELPVQRSDDHAAVRADLHLLHEALRHQPTHVERVLQQAEAHRLEDLHRYRTDPTPRQHRFYRGCVDFEHVARHTNILDCVIRYADGVPAADDEVIDRADQLLEQLLEEIERYYDLFHGQRQPVKAKQQAAGFINRLRRESEALGEADPSNAIHQRQLARIEARERKLRTHR